MSNTVVDDKRAHLEMIQGIVNRLSHNSFLLKGWSVILVSGLFALAANDSNDSFVLVALLPATVFWGLDSYFLHQERLFRGLYDHVRGLNTSEIDYSMDTNKIKNQVPPLFAVAFSNTIIVFHGVVILTSVVTAIIIN